jgi:hypothetical protein
MLQLPPTTDWGGDTAWGSHCHYLGLWFLAIACGRSEFNMITLVAGFRMGVVMVARPHTGEGVLAMGNAKLDMSWLVESVCVVPQIAGVIWLFQPGVVVWINCVPSLCSRWGELHRFSDIWSARTIQQRWGGGVPTLECRATRTSCLRGIPPAGWYRNVSPSRGQVKIS